jgi:hypothetical protein
VEIAVSLVILVIPELVVSVESLVIQDTLDIQASKVILVPAVFPATQASQESLDTAEKADTPVHLDIQA